MGVVTDFEYEISKLCDGSRSAMKIAIKLGGVSVESVKRSLNKLEDLDIIKMN